MNDNPTPSESPEDLGNTVDGTRTGDGSDARPAAGEQDPGGPGTGGRSAESPEQGSEQGSEPGSEQGSGPTSGHEGADHDRAEQKQVYRTPDQPDHALGGSEGTTDGS